MFPILMDFSNKTYFNDMNFLTNLWLMLTVCLHEDDLNESTGNDTYPFRDYDEKEMAK